MISKVTEWLHYLNYKTTFSVTKKSSHPHLTSNKESLCSLHCLKNILQSFKDLYYETSYCMEIQWQQKKDSPTIANYPDLKKTPLPWKSIAPLNHTLQLLIFQATANHPFLSWWRKRTLICPCSRDWQVSFCSVYNVSDRYFAVDEIRMQKFKGAPGM